jgi:hypothetical protein
MSHIKVYMFRSSIYLKGSLKNAFYIKIKCNCLALTYNSAILLSYASAVITFYVSAIFYVICMKCALHVKWIYFKYRRRNIMRRTWMYKPRTGWMTEAFITYTKFDISLLRHVFICCLMLRHVSAIAFGHLQGCRKYLTCTVQLMFQLI